MHTAHSNDMSGAMAVLGLLSFTKFVIFLFFLVIWGLPWALDVIRLLVTHNG
jgi:hypothetical protein